MECAILQFNLAAITFNIAFNKIQIDDGQMMGAEKNIIHGNNSSKSFNVLEAIIFWFVNKVNVGVVTAASKCIMLFISKNNRPSNVGMANLYRFF